MNKKKLGVDPFRGVNSLVRNTQEDTTVQDEPIAQETPELKHTSTEKYVKTQGHKGQKLSRINLAFQPDALKYIHLLSGFDGVSITQYVNSLIFADMERRRDTYSKLLELKES
ncbi:MAG: hypothetical protein LBU51_09980 [Bacteroidales bacterium]|jgi:hypothetical protein|nr:hypothetical protein [Bacteroidales bacterium]